MTLPSGSAVALLRRAGIRPEGSVPWGSPPPTRLPGVYMVELSAPMAIAPLDTAAIARWRGRVPTITVDGSTATATALAERLAAFWIPSAAVIYIGQASGSVRKRVGDYYSTPLGDARPHAGGHWIKTLTCLPSCRVWSAATDDFDAVERKLLDDFRQTVPAAEREVLYDASLILPFANLRDGWMVRKLHGVRASTLR
jgi:hypothetical protein